MLSRVRSGAGFGAIVLCISGAAWSQNPQTPEEILRHALQLQQAGDIESAISEYRNYLSQVPADPMARSNLGAALSRAGRYQEAIAQYNKALELQPGNLPVRINLALAYYKALEIPQAAAELERALAERPGERQVILLLSDCYLRLRENGKAVDLLSPLQQQAPGDKAIEYMLGTALIRDGQAQRGQALIDLILRDGDSAEGRFLRGEAKLAASDPEGAIQDFKKALELNPQLPGLNAYYAAALTDVSDFRAAEAALRNDLALRGDTYADYFQLGKVLEQEEKYTESRACFERALAQRPNDLAARYELASLDLKEGQTERARAALENLVHENPGDVRAHIALATAYYRLERKQDGNKQRAIVLELNAEKQVGPSGGVGK